jgi:hypothetical protein
MNDINELSLDEQLKQGTTRRTVVTTGAKLAYAAPLVAATVGLTASGALAVCGGITPFPFTFDGDSLCCGCCPQATRLSAKALKKAVAAQQANAAFAECQEILAGQGIECPLAGEPGSDVERVCIAPDAKLT